MKSLSTQEMSMQNGLQKISPNIIARLMGLDEPLPQREYKPVENQQCRLILSEKARGKKAYDDHKSLRRGLMDEQKFKDVFEVLDAEKEKSSRNVYQRRVEANLTEADMALIRQKFMEAKRLSTDEKLRYSKEFNETLEALDYNKDLLLKLLHHPNSLSTEHLPDFQSIPPKLHCSQATTLKLSNSPNHVDNFEILKVDRELLGKSHRSPQWHGGGGNPRNSNTRCVDTADLSKKQLNKISGLKPTEIIVLKPNLGTPLTTGRTQSSSCDEAREDRRLSSTRNRESKAFGNLNANEHISLLRRKSGDSRAIARIVTRQMKAGCGNDSSMNFEISRFRGYAGSKSSSGGDSSSESKLVSVISRARTEFIRKNHPQSLPFRSSESSVSKETMRRLSERWKLARNSEQDIEIRRRNTLAEMLATSDREASPESFNGITFRERLSKRFESNVGQQKLLEPVGISSRDGWKTTCKRNHSKPKIIMHQDRTCGYTIVLPKKLATRDGLVKGSSFHNREFFSSNNYTPSSSKLLCTDDELSKEKLPAFKAQRILSVHAGSDNEDAKTTLSLEPPDLSAVTSLSNPDISGKPTEEDHSSIPQLQPLESAEEGDQPSPVSILQNSFHNEYSSSSECFESLSSDLQGLRMQLQLLKLESSTHNEGTMLVSSNEDADEEESSILTNETIITQELGEDWKSSYLTDILANSRFSDLDHESFMATWHSSESPVDPSLFKDLEKKYSCLKTSTQLEMKLLFDRINSEILEFFNQFTDPQPWFKPTKVFPKWDINKIHETLHKLVSTKYMKPSRETKEKELQWLNLEDDIEVIGKKIEELLTDELIAELMI